MWEKMYCPEKKIMNDLFVGYLTFNSVVSM